MYIHAMPKGEFQKHHQIKSIRENARSQRKSPTRSEDMLWQALRNRQLNGLKFLRQHRVGSSILDFYCHRLHLAIEIDGGYHQQKDVQEQDRFRQELIEGNGIKFFRCTADEVEQDLPGVLAKISEITKHR